MGLTVPSAREEFSDFAAFYDQQLAPSLASRESQRIAALKRSAIVLGLAILIAGYVFIKIGGDFGAIGAAIVMVLGAGFASAQLAKMRSAVTDELLSQITAQLKLRYTRECSQPEFAYKFIQRKLLPKFTIENWEDRIDGQRHGADFSLIEAKLQIEVKGKRKETRTVFHGQLLVIDYHQEFQCETVIMRDKGLLNALGRPGSAFQRVGLSSLRFEKIFEAWATDQVEARVLLDPLVLERFEELDRLFDGAKFRAAFANGKLFIALEVGDKLNGGSMFQPLHNPQRVETVLKEFDLIYDLIDVATRRIDGRLDGAFSVDAVSHS